MARSLIIGGLDPASFALREGAALPLLDDALPIQEWFADCLQHAVAERKGVVLLSAQGAGKSVAVKRGVRTFDRAERARRGAKEASYEPRQVAVVTTLRAESAKELFVALYRAAFKTAMVERIYRRQKTSDELRDELIARCDEEGVVAFVIDEAQTLTDEALDALRDLMAVAESMSEAQIEETSRGDMAKPAGIGVLLVATLAFLPRLTALEEFTRRWVRAEVVAVPEEAAVPDVLRRLLPAFEAGAQALGAEGWASLVAATLTMGRQVPIATLHDFTRTYLRRAAADQPTARKIQQLAWDVDLFRQAAYELVGFHIPGQEAA